MNMIPASPEQRPTKRVRFPSADLSHIAHIDAVAKEDRQEYWYTPAEYGVIEREIKQTVRRLRKRAAAELKLESELFLCTSSSSSSSSTSTTTAAVANDDNDDELSPPAAPPTKKLRLLDPTKYCDRGLEDFVHHYETKQLKTTIAKVILAEQDLQRVRGIRDPVALMQVSLACTHLSRQQAKALGEQDAKDVQREVVFALGGGGAPPSSSSTSSSPLTTSRDADQYLFSHDMTNICNEITKSSSSSSSNGKENELAQDHMTLFSICDRQPNIILGTEITSN